MGHSAYSPRNVLAFQRENEAVKLRVAGKTYQEIAEILGVAYSTVYEAVSRAVKKLNIITMEETKILREIEAQRLDMWLQGIMSKAANGDIASIYAGLKIMERRARLFGLDAPVRRIIDWRGELQGRGIADGRVFEMLVEKVLAESELVEITETNDAIQRPGLQLEGGPLGGGPESTPGGGLGGGPAPEEFGEETGDMAETDNALDYPLA